MMMKELNCLKLIHVKKKVSSYMHMTEFIFISLYLFFLGHILKRLLLVTGVSGCVEASWKPK